MHSSSISDWIQRIHQRDRNSLSKAITLVESTRAEDQEVAIALLSEIEQHHPGLSYRIGITGSPGVGKSSLIEVLGLQIIESGHRLAVLTIDPSSSLHMGSILGDKSRMPQLSQHPLAFIRSTPSANVLGGLSKHTRDVIQLMECAGYDRIIIESVGVGQSEFDIGLIADLLIYLVQPASGDELQAMKKGIMEWADVFVITKSDGVMEKLANETMAELLVGKQYLTAENGSIHSAVFKTSIFKIESIQALLDYINKKYNLLIADNKLISNRFEKNGLYFDQHWIRSVSDALMSEPSFVSYHHQLKSEILSGNISVQNAFEKLIKFIFALR